MKKQILNFGKQLSKNEQKGVFGGASRPLRHYDPNCEIFVCCDFDSDCSQTRNAYGSLVDGWCSGGYCNL